MSILQKTKNFFRLYDYACGESEVPRIYHFWSCVALISAVLEDRCWCEIYKDEPIKPNLYICLVGPGSVGKGLAISHAVRLVERASQTQVYRGKVTYAHLIDHMGKVTVNEWGQRLMPRPCLWLIMDELKNGVGSNHKLAEEFIGLMTELYTATNYKLKTGTRTHGEVELENPNLNWFFGSNETWLRQTITKAVLESGFVARTAFIYADYDLDLRIPRIIYPADHDQVYAHLMQRVWLMQAYQGRFLMTPTAEAEFDRWYHTRACPTDEALFSTWKRQKEMLLRFAMVNCVADGEEMIITHGHIVRAEHMVKQIAEFSMKMLAGANETKDSRPANLVETLICKKGTISWSQLSREMRGRGFNKRIFKEAVDTLVQEGTVGTTAGPRGGVIYVWKG